MKTDGTVAGTQKLMTLPGPLASSPGNTTESMLAVGNLIYFRVNASDGTAKLWKTDGTATGTVPVKTPTGPPTGTITAMAVLGNSLLFFAATDTTVGTNKISNFAPHLWRTDGTDVGTKLISTTIGLVTAMRSTDSLLIFNIGNASTYKDYFAINDYGGGVYRTDGSVNGTKKIAPLPTERSGLRAANIQYIQVQKDAIYLGNNEDIWRLGYRAGSTTQLVQGVSVTETYYLVGAAGEKTFVQKNRKLGGKDDGIDLLFFNNSAIVPTLINSFTGTNAISVYYNIATSLKNKFLFAGKTSSNGNVNPWISDGTATGTFMLKNIDYSMGTGIIGDNAYFLSARPSVGTAPIVSDMYRTDGTIANTQSTSFSVSSGLGLNYLAASADKIFFSIRNSSTTNNEEVWVYSPVTKANGCSLTASITSTQALSFCSSAGTTLMANPANGTSPYQYRWAKDNSPISTTSASLNTSTGGTYSLTITDACSPASVASITLTALESPTVLIDEGLVNCTGKPTALTAIVKGGTAPYSYNWVINGASASTAPVFSTTATNFYYQVYVTSANQCTGSSPYLFFNGAPKPLSVTITGSTTLCSGQTGMLNAALANGTGPFTYVWKQNGAVVGNNAASLSIASGGTYSLSVTDACSSTMATLTVVASPSPSVVVSGGQSICTGQSATLTATATGGTGAYAYQWRQGATLVASGTASLTTATPGSYVVSVTDAKGCGVTSSAVTVSSGTCATPTITLPPGGATATLAITLSANTGLTGGADAGATYQWLLNGNVIPGAASPTYTASSSGSYAVVVSLNGRVTTSPAVNIVISLLLGTEALSPFSDSQVSVYPNPTTSECQVVVDLPSKQAVTFMLTDASGKVIRQWTTLLFPKMVPIRVQLPTMNGLYLLRVETESGVVVKRLLRLD